MHALAASTNIVDMPGHTFFAAYGSSKAFAQCAHAPPVPVDALLDVVEAGAVELAFEVGVPPAPVPLDEPGIAIDPPHAATIARRRHEKRPMANILPRTRAPKGREHHPEHRSQQRK
jgi:hypothetical protein